ncbi:aspartate/glutamate racemase family protein [Acuticoccus sp. I52.16.1]|uniref:aspartate/glutamate racemase family protein n=1 Tax=Acuticoccus sp. I52.16.1 TaxID=2928472 RepID=UPI001FD1E399|nr:amino acid racemase [Acuticoccus sp. I52.16.1]UOM37353.1 amino acid racemase [Acuticoccus sp. I52.16.1]
MASEGEGDGGPRILGVLGGMGPEATILLMQRILEATPAPAGRPRDDADHLPLLVDNNTQVPSRIRHLVEGTGEDPGPTLAAMARRLEAAGAAALAMPCNTAHAYAGAIREAVRLPFLDMVALTADAAAPLPAGPAGILASPATRITGIFAAAFAARGREVIHPADEAAMLGAIRAVKAGQGERARPVLEAAAAELAGAGAAVLIVGCSEFSLLSRGLAATVPVIDTLDVLAVAAVRFALAPRPLPA